MFACNAEYHFLACHTGFSVWIIFGGPAMNLESAFVATIRIELAALVLGTNVDTLSSSNSPVPFTDRPFSRTWASSDRSPRSNSFSAAQRCISHKSNQGLRQQWGIVCVWFCDMKETFLVARGGCLNGHLGLCFWDSTQNCKQRITKIKELMYNILLETCSPHFCSGTGFLRFLR